MSEILTEQELEPQTKNTIIDLQLLHEEPSIIRDQGYAVSDEVKICGMRAVRAPILGRDGDVIGAVSVSEPTSRLKREQFESEISETVMKVANLIEVSLETAQFERRD